ncbi:hypothetical protein MUK42_14220 [Musa troglodytarum]|uniref:Uncharacterized protein n=1 Tax=Musa troglodytarum TaxID=320322 RepID=A0A9E7HIG8_9LILI|nr:hypothetical protein MUK42_30781 [Musa troglodytarum]URE34290.1 hypothetical protein MUK42_14220 [Musa troglodytarum]
MEERLTLVLGVIYLRPLHSIHAARRCKDGEEEEEAAAAAAAILRDGLLRIMVKVAEADSPSKELRGYCAVQYRRPLQDDRLPIRWRITCSSEEIMTPSMKKMLVWLSQKDNIRCHSLLQDLDFIEILDEFTVANDYFTYSNSFQKYFG